MEAGNLQRYAGCEHEGSGYEFFVKKSIQKDDILRKTMITYSLLAAL